MAPGWTPVVAAVDSSGADVALLSTRRHGQSETMQLKVIAANRRYRTFGTQATVPLGLPVDPRGLAIVHDHGAPVLVVLDRRARRLRVVSLW
jgi:hypothetical protein